MSVLCAGFLLELAGAEVPGPAAHRAQLVPRPQAAQAVHQPPHLPQLATIIRIFAIIIRLFAFIRLFATISHRYTSRRTWTQRSHHHPSARSQHPSAVNYHPSARNYLPSARNYHPPIRNYLPSARSQYPAGSPVCLSAAHRCGLVLQAGRPAAHTSEVSTRARGSLHRVTCHVSPVTCHVSRVVLSPSVWRWRGSAVCRGPPPTTA